MTPEERAATLRPLLFRQEDALSLERLITLEISAAIREAYEDAARIAEALDEQTEERFLECLGTEIAAAIRARSMEQVEQPPQQVAPDKPDSGKHG
jgi:Mn-dependent DtxR family transcriptional regulator